MGARLVTARYELPLAESDCEAPVLETRKVQVGANFVLNFVIAVSVLLPTITGPLVRLTLSPETQLRAAPFAELRTKEEIAPVLETFSKRPSRIPATFFPARVSALDPKIVEDQSGFRATALNSLLLLPK